MTSTWTVRFANCVSVRRSPFADRADLAAAASGDSGGPGIEGLGGESPAADDDEGVQPKQTPKQTCVPLVVPLPVPLWLLARQLLGDAAWCRAALGRGLAVVWLYERPGLLFTLPTKGTTPYGV